MNRKITFERKYYLIFIMLITLILPLNGNIAFRNSTHNTSFGVLAIQKLKHQLFERINHITEVGPTPTASIFAIQPSCNNGAIQSDGYLQISAYTNGDRYNFSIGSTYSGNTDYANAMVIGALPFQFNTGLSNPMGSQDYTVRVFNGASDCFLDITVTMKEQDCLLSCDCNENIYLNETTNNGRIHKFKINPNFQIGVDPPMSIISNEIGNPWFDNDAAGETVINPHGLGVDLNGYLYIGESNRRSTSNIRKFTCDGEIFPTSDFIIPNEAGFNFASKDGLLYVGTQEFGNTSIENVINVYDLCTSNLVGFYCLDQVANQKDWGLFMSEDGTMYVTSDFNAEGNSNDAPNQLYRFNVNTTPLNPVGATSPTCISPFISEGANPPSIGNNYFARDRVFGVTVDAAGNFYIAERTFSGETDYPGGGAPDNSSRILKYNSSGNLVAISDYDVVEGDGGYIRAIGVYYLESLDALLVSTASPSDDCVSLFDANLNYLGAVVPATGNNAQAKGINVLKECCPTNNNVTIDTILCSTTINSTYFLQELINCSGTICEGVWEEGTSNTGLTYDTCDNSVIINALNACGTFTLQSDGTGNNPQCGAFRITVNIEVGNVIAPEVSGNQVVCEGGDPAAFTVTTAASGSATLSYQWQSSPDSLTGYTDISGATSATYDPPSGITDTTFYKVITMVDGGCSTGNCKDTSHVISVHTMECCTNPTATATAVEPTCTGNTPNSDGYLQLSAVTNGDRYHYSTGNTFDDNGGANTYTNATDLSGATYPLQFATGQPNPVGTQDYTIRVYNGANDCFSDVIVTMNQKDCSVCTIPTTFQCQFYGDETGNSWTTDADCAITTCTGTAVRMRAVPNSANYTFEWRNPSSVVVGTNRVLILNNILSVDAGTYTLNITDTSTGCTSTKTFDLTVVDANIAVVDPTCGGVNDGTITVTPTLAGTYTYSIDGSNFQSSNTFTNLVEGNYTVYFKNSTMFDTCSIGNVVLERPAPKATAFAIQPSCTNNVLNSDGYLQISGYSNADRYNFSIGSTYTGNSDYANASTIGALPFKFSLGLSNPSGTQDYTIRLFNAESACFTDFVVTMNEQTCQLSCDCEENLYLNDESLNEVHKFRIANNGDVTEIGNPWLAADSIIDPHGLAIDLNGQIYIGAVDSFDTNIEGPLYKLDCDGNILDTNFLAPVTEFSFNYGSHNGVLYLPNNKTYAVDAYSLCDASYLGSMKIANGNATHTWGFYMDEENWYVPDRTSGTVYSGSLDLTLYDNLATETGTALFSTGFTGDYLVEAAMGITRDNSGNFFIVFNNFTGDLAEPKVRKYSSTGTLLATVTDNTSTINLINGQAGFWGARGITYSKTTNYIYISSRDNCLSVFDESLTELVARNIGNPDNTKPKGIGVTKECCPTSNHLVIDTILCTTNVGEKVFLQNLINCDGSVCEGLWTATSGTTGMTYNSCDNSVTINTASACGSFVLESDGLGANPKCGAFVITVNIEVGNVTASIINNPNQTWCEGGDPAAFTVTTTASGSATLSYQWQSSSDSLTGYTDISGATSATYDPPSGITDTTFYKVITMVDGGCSTGNCKDTSNIVSIHTLPCDWGDLPDTSATLNRNDYQTTSTNNGPVHVIIPGLKLGLLVDAENDGQPDTLAFGDDNNSDDEDGLIIFPSLNIAPGGTIRLPLTVTNTTGNIAHLEAWIDWNGDGDFEGTDEMVANYMDAADGVFPVSMNINVPSDALTDNLLGFRIRLSNSDNMTPYGKVNSGEIEDYLIGIECPQPVCLPIEIEMKRE